MFELFPWVGTHGIFTDFGLLGGGNEGSNIQMFELSVGRYPGFRADFGLQEDGGGDESSNIRMFEFLGLKGPKLRKPVGRYPWKKVRTFEYSNIGF